MSLSIKALNDDTSFLLTFSPLYSPTPCPRFFPGSFTILVDPWLKGSAEIFSPKFSHTVHVTKPCIGSLREIPDPDMIIVSQDKPDHCHRETLCELSSKSSAVILGTPAAAKKIRGWNHFNPANIKTLKKYNAEQDETIFRVVLPPMFSSASPGEVTVTLISAKRDITGLHNAIGITYRPPCSVLSPTFNRLVDLPPTPPESPTSPFRPSFSSSATTVIPLPPSDRERTVSVLYSPHGVPYEHVDPWAVHHLVTESALPLAALIHSFDVVQNPWYLGGNISTGCPGGLQVARNLLPKVWISAHDEDKDVRGLGVQRVTTEKYYVTDVQNLLEKSWGGEKHRRTNVVSLEPDEEYNVKMRP
ncbi:hypothetical protein LTS18_006157 [Coniosporium uncinatum]|uniref:Uncharacterized protein n=1 Tax=Coniosporium uncinatum TaxID=93489 RepID=A0ACC3DQM4_9PEZI|nr:hypothetical protein LTS18_006157 [Coniosporium uncinatum]